MRAALLPLLLAGTGLLVWPGSTSGRRTRLRAVRGPRRRAPFGLAPTSMPAPVAMAGAAGAAGAAGCVLSTPLVAALAATAAALGARAGLRRRADSRAETGLRALAEALGVLAAEIRAGRPTREAVGTALAACPDGATAAALRTRLLGGGSVVPGISGSALSGALDRVAAAVELSARTGCSLAAVVGAVEDDLRARSAAAQELRSAVAGPRASALVLAGLPGLGLVMGAGVGADPWGVLTGTTLGQVLLVAGVALEAAGLAWSARLVARAVR